MKDLLVHSNPVQCTVTVSVHCNNKDFQDLIYFYICYISKQRLLSSFRDSFVLISNLSRLFDALHPTVGHFQSFKLSSFTLGFIQTIPVSMFFPFFLFNPTVFSYFDKNTRFYNQGISIWVRLKPQLCNRRADSALPHTNMKSHLVNPAAYRGGWKQHFVFAYSQVQICSGGYCNTQKALPAPHSELRPALMLSPGWMLIWIVISCVRRTLLMCEMASGSLAGKMSDFSSATGLFSSPLYIILPRNLRCLVLTCNWN